MRGEAGPAETGTSAGAAGEQSGTAALNAEIQDCLVELTSRIIGQAERVAQRLSVPAIFIKALHVLDAPMAMKDLGKRMHCDPSFVTAVADMLEKHGLARRAAHPGDRRVRQLILTGEGCEVRRRLETELSARMPWSSGLDDAERAQLLALIRKMLRAVPSSDDAGPDRGPGSLASGLMAAGLASAAAAPDTPPAGSPSRPAAPAGEVGSSLGSAPAAS
jgi:DNA-binding MarR family transcriptional regulator